MVCLMFSYFDFFRLPDDDVFFWVLYSVCVDMS